MTSTPSLWCRKSRSCTFRGMVPHSMEPPLSPRQISWKYKPRSVHDTRCQAIVRKAFPSHVDHAWLTAMVWVSSREVLTADEDLNKPEQGTGVGTQTPMHGFAALRLPGHLL